MEWFVVLLFRSDGSSRTKEVKQFNIFLHNFLIYFVLLLNIYQQTKSLNALAVAVIDDIYE